MRGGSLYSSLCFCICLKFFTVKSFKKNEMSPMRPLYRWTEKTPEAGRKIGGNWGVGNLRFLTMGGLSLGLASPPGTCVGDSGASLSPRRGEESPPSSETQLSGSS